MYERHRIMTLISRTGRWSSALARLTALTVLAFVMLTAPAAASDPFAADFSVPGEPIDLLTDANVRIDGAAANDFSGSPVSSAGDVNGDGRDDVIVGASYADNNDRRDSGSAYVIYGSASLTTLDLVSLGKREGFRIDGGAVSDYAGGSASAAGDVNGDGLDDVIVGAMGADNNRRSQSGSVYVIYGKRLNLTVKLANIGVRNSKRGFRIDGAAAGDYSGRSVSDAGDVNGDGRDDVILGAYSTDNNGRPYSGSAYIIYGSVSPTTIDLNDLDSDEGFRIDGAAMDDYAGYSVSNAGDVNGDGRDDVILGAYRTRNNGRVYSGSAYVIFGSASSATIDLNDLGSEDGFRIDGAATEDNAGMSVSGAGDVNGDGRDDVIVGATGADNNGRTNSGSAYFIFGSASVANIDLYDLGSEEGFRIDGAASYDNAGISVSAARDQNGDGRDDLFVGAYKAGNNDRDFSGSAYVIFGSASPTTIDLERLVEEKGFRIDGAAEYNYVGRSVSAAGDVNGDGRDDLIVGAHGADNNGRLDSGSAYMIYAPSKR